METGENKNPTLETLKKVAKALEVSVDDLIN
jgi:DNA-binding Xre family transcriptional regulator